MAELPPWMESLVDAVARSMTAHGPIGPLGVRYRLDEGLWDILVYAVPVEMIGGAHDGGRAAPSFSMDLAPLQQIFARVNALGWEPHGADPDAGPCLSVHGETDGHPVWLRVLAYAPADVRPSLKVDATRRAA